MFARPKSRRSNAMRHCRSMKNPLKKGRVPSGFYNERTDVFSGYLSGMGDENRSRPADWDDLENGPATGSIETRLDPRGQPDGPVASTGRSRRRQSVVWIVGLYRGSIPLQISQ